MITSSSSTPQSGEGLRSFCFCFCEVLVLWDILGARAPPAPTAPGSCRTERELKVWPVPPQVGVLFVDACETGAFSFSLPLLDEEAILGRPLSTWPEPINAGGSYGDVLV